MFMGSSGAGKTTITQALYGEDIEYHKTQYVNYSEYIVDPPGEYIEDKQFGFALTLYSYEVDVIGFVLAATEHGTIDPCRVTDLDTDIFHIGILSYRYPYIFQYQLVLKARDMCFLYLLD